MVSLLCREQWYPLVGLMVYEGNIIIPYKGMVFLLYGTVAKNIFRGGRPLPKRRFLHLFIAFVFVVPLRV